MDTIYPLGPVSVPADLTRATSRYRKHAWLAVLGLLLFVVVYFALAVWFCWGAYLIIAETAEGQRGALLGYLVGGCSAFLGLFMFKALFFVKRGGQVADMEVTAESQPRLFTFLNQLADEAGAPRPHQVFLSPRVNACVFYDLSILNFLFSSRKNLEIGLPLVNALSLGELKAVLAHEFGHFAQKSMAVGRWVYIAQQIAGHIVSKRDYLDSLLRGISRIDIRIAWIGWLMQLIVWSIRSLMDSLFAIVVIAQRALSREMEFHADLVAVSLTGSDALINALHKLQSADDAWNRSLSFANSEVAEKRAIHDLFAIQNQITEKLRYILDDPEYGLSVSLPETGAEKHRVFKDVIAHPPKMWETHPNNNEREENAKRIYIASQIDDRSAWELFDDAPGLRQQATAELLKDIECQDCDIEDTLKNLDQHYSHKFLNPRYKGSYLGRDLTRNVEQPDQLYDEVFSGPVSEAFVGLYPQTLADNLNKLRSLEEELFTLRALRDGFLKAPGGVIRHNGKEYKRKQLNELITGQEGRVAEVKRFVDEHEKKCRTAHLAAAKVMGKDWQAYLKGLISVLHYTEHTLSEVRDVRGLLNNVVAVIFADGNVSSGELKRLIKTGHEVCDVLAKVYAGAAKLNLDKSLLKRLEIDSWARAFGEFTLPYPDKKNINEWMNAIDSWFGASMNALSHLHSETLEQLLTTETYISHKYKEAVVTPMGFGISSVPTDYTRLLPGNERKLQKKLGLWDRFQTAEGFLGAFLRFTVAGSIVGSVLWFSFNIVFYKNIHF